MGSGKTQSIKAVLTWCLMIMSVMQHLSLCLDGRQLCEKEPRVACCTTSSGEDVTFLTPSLVTDQGRLRLLQSYSSSSPGREVPVPKVTPSLEATVTLG